MDKEKPVKALKKKIKRAMQPFQFKKDVGKRTLDKEWDPSKKIAE